MKKEIIKKGTKKTGAEKAKVNPTLNGKYDDQPVFQDKVARANHILKIAGIPKFG